MKELIMMVGIAGSGKSTIAKNIAASIDAEIVSSDAIRGELWGNENDQREPAKVFEEANRRIRAHLKAGRSVIFDATNLNCKRRMNFLKEFGRLADRTVCKLVITTPEDINARMVTRDRKVSPEVIHKQLCQFQCPNYYEGWDDIYIWYGSKQQDCANSFQRLSEECFALAHDNPHHQYDVDAHMSMAAHYVYITDKSKRSSDNVWLARIHDIGKARTKSFVDRKGNPTEHAHFIGHQNYGAYYSLLFNADVYDMLNKSDNEKLDEACLIQWHMEHYLRGEKINDFYTMIGAELTERLKLLERADAAAH